MSLGIVASIDKEKRLGKVGREGNGTFLLFEPSDCKPGVVFNELRGKRVEYQECRSDDRGSALHQHAQIFRVV